MRLWFKKRGDGIDLVEHEQWRLRQVDVPTKPQRKVPLVFLLLIVGVLAVASTAAVIVDVKTDGYQFHADRKTLRFS